jgi:hypothetical protein
METDLMKMFTKRIIPSGPESSSSQTMTILAIFDSLKKFNRPPYHSDLTRSGFLLEKKKLRG